MAASLFPSVDLRKLLAFGSGIGIEIGATDLEVAAARVRPSGIQVLGRITLANYAERPAAEWREVGNGVKTWKSPWEEA